MSELDNPQPNIEDDAKNIATVNINDDNDDDNDGNMAAEATDYEKLRDELKNYLAPIHYWKKWDSPWTFETSWLGWLLEQT